MQILSKAFVTRAFCTEGNMYTETKAFFNSSGYPARTIAYCNQMNKLFALH